MYQESLSNQDYLPLSAAATSEVKPIILLVEDQVIIAKVTKVLFTHLNCDVDVAPDGKTAIQYASSTVYDLIITDINLPDTSGDEITRQIRTVKQNKYTPIVALTANMEAKNKESYLKAGMQAVFPKPLTKVIALEIFKTFISTMPG